MERGVDYVSRLDLCQMVANKLGVELGLDGLTSDDSPRLVLVECLVNEDPVDAAMKEAGYVFVDRSGVSLRTIMHRIACVSRPLAHWDFPLRQPENGGALVTFDHRLQLRAAMEITEPGVVLLPEIWTPSETSEAGNEETERLYRVVAEAMKDQFFAGDLALALGLASELTVTWDRLGLPRMRCILDLFREFAGLDPDLTLKGIEGGFFYPDPSDFFLDYRASACFSPSAGEIVKQNWLDQAARLKRSSV